MRNALKNVPADEPSVTAVPASRTRLARNEAADPALRASCARESCQPGRYDPAAEMGTVSPSWPPLLGIQAETAP
jgi:hypothetical protein